MPGGRRNRDLFNAAIAGSRVVKFAKSGHMPQVEEPEALLAAVGSFLDG